MNATEGVQMNFNELCQQLELKIQNAYTEGISLENAERLSGEFLYAQMQVSNELKKSDLNARMRKSGVKAIRAAIYLQEITGKEKKPTEAQLTAILDSDITVSSEQQSFDEAEVDRASLERYYDIFVQAHVYFRQLAKGSMG